MSVPPEFVAQVLKVAQALDTLDYFQILRVPRDAPFETIRAAYHKQARLFHPDRYAHLGMTELSAALTAVSKRVAEAYTVLRDDQRRARYQKDVEGEHRAQRLRYSEESQTAAKEEKQAAAGTTPQGRQMYHQATAAWSRGDKAAAIQSLKMALVYEGQNQGFKALLEEWSREAK